jgi:hypothetical protein
MYHRGHRLRSERDATVRAAADASRNGLNDQFVGLSDALGTFGRMSAAEDSQRQSDTGRWSDKATVRPS